MLTKKTAAYNSVFLKLCQDVEHSALNRYFAFVGNWDCGFSYATTS